MMPELPPEEPEYNHGWLALLAVGYPVLNFIAFFVVMAIDPFAIFHATGVVFVLGGPVAALVLASVCQALGARYHWVFITAFGIYALVIGLINLSVIMQAMAAV